MTIKNSTFSGNQAWQGGAIFNRIGGGATIAIESSTFDDNLASNSEGGAIFNQGGALAIKSSNFSGNQAESSQAGWGGAIFAWGSQNMIQATMFVGNEATNFGGAIVCAYSSCEISGSTFKENVAKDDFGGAILVQGSSRLVVVSYNDFVANKDKEGAGAVYLEAKSTCNMQGNNFTDNTSGGSEIIHVARMDGPSEFECSQGNTFNPPQDELLLPLECDVDRTASPTEAPTDPPTGAPTSATASPTSIREGCACAATMDEIKIVARIYHEIPVCGGSTIEFSGPAIDVSGKNFRLFSVDCNGNEDESVEPAVLEGNEHFSTNEGSDHQIVISRVKFVRKGGDAQSCIHTKGTGGILDVLECAFEGNSTNVSLAGPFNRRIGVRLFYWMDASSPSFAVAFSHLLSAWTRNSQ
uniref:Right handed beta helix domain-containing protein n=1 Tax=Grammatophora oceanica TaxID=210454 RepID=A0A7S1V8H8_9STRA